MEIPQHFHIHKKDLPELIELLQRIMIGQPDINTICVDLEFFYKTLKQSSSEVKRP
jgi:hypothetical protein